MNSLKTFTVGAGGAAVIEVTDIQVHSVAVSAVSNWMFLRISTHEGLVGWGEMTLSKLRRAFPSLPSSRAGNAVLSALDQALCDIEGQARWEMCRPEDESGSLLRCQVPDFKELLPGD
jgi:hypothetical protein